MDAEATLLGVSPYSIENSWVAVTLLTWNNPTTSEKAPNDTVVNVLQFGSIALVNML